MALSPEEREKITEEETLRFETRKNLHSGACARRPGGGMRWLWFVAFFALGYAMHGLCGRFCPWHGNSCAWAGSGMGMVPAHCMLGHGMMPSDGQEQPAVPGSAATKP